MTQNAIEIKDLRLTYTSRQSFSVRNSLFRLQKSTPLRVEALRGVSFDVTKGEVLGIVGRNGSGKTTLLQTMAGVFAPDSGSIDLKGNSISLLTLGTGFQTELSGRENILLHGLLLGFSREQLLEKMDEIIAFSELGDAIERPLRTYSSGMNSKLAFSISAILETDILLIDEILSVGDTAFREKSSAKVRELIEDRERTALIVSHQEASLRALCNRILWLHDGLVREFGDTGPVLDHYLEYMSKSPRTD